ncbi:Pentatricopeptide repeat-containing protein, partial [Cucurbita argyrosperma subsp. argyrosperma]
MVVTGFIHHTPSLNKLIAHVLSMGSLGVAYAYSVFTHTRELDILTWNTMLRGFVNSDMPRRALRSYIEMLQWSRIVPDRFTFPSLLKGCALSLEFKVGKVLHGQIVKYRLDSDLYIETTLLNMYASCGDFRITRDSKNGGRWFSPVKLQMGELVSASAELTDWVSGMQLHSRIQRDGNRKMDSWNILRGTETGIVRLVWSNGRCRHVDQCGNRSGQENALIGMSKIEDLNLLNSFGNRSRSTTARQAGRLVEAREFIQAMPLQPNGAIWGAMLGACRVYNDLELGEESVRCLLELEPTNDGVYILLSNIYAKRQMWNEVKSSRIDEREREFQKTPG